MSKARITAVANPMRRGESFVVWDMPPQPYPDGRGGVVRGAGGQPRMQLPPAVLEFSVSDGAAARIVEILNADREWGGT